MQRLAAFFALLLMLCLTACMTAGNLKPEKLHGLWKDGRGAFYFLDEDGELSLLRNGDAAGLNWEFDGTALVLVTQKAPGSDPEQRKLFLQKRGLFSLEFLDENGVIVTWSRSFKKVGRLEGTLFFRERMMLPPEVTVCARLLASEGGDVVGQSMALADGRSELRFSVCFLEEDLSDTAFLRASVFYGEEPLFATPGDVAVNRSERPSVLLHHAVPSQKKELALLGTYWRLTELGGKPAEHFADQPEAHLILSEKGDAAGSDGCNNFFMGWESEGNGIRFLPGGATLRMCPHGEEQARSMLQMLPSVKTWNISGGQLELRSEDKLEAVFEAVEM